MLTTIKTYALYMALGAAIIIGLNSFGYPIEAGVRSAEKGYTPAEREIINSMAACIDKGKMK